MNTWGNYYDLTWNLYIEKDGGKLCDLFFYTKIEEKCEQERVYADFIL